MKSSRWILGLVTLALLLTGCPEKRRPAGSAAPANAPASGSSNTKSTPTATGPLADYAHNLMNAEKKATEVTGLAAIEQALNQFNVIEGRYPKSLDELVAMRYMVKIPPAVRGERFIYDPSNGSIKSVALPVASDAPQAPAAAPEATVNIAQPAEAAVAPEAPPTE